MNSWYITDGGKRWRLCRVVTNVLGLATVELYDGSRESGKARRAKHGYEWIVEERNHEKS